MPATAMSPSPTQSRRAPAAEEIRFTIVESSVGLVLVGVASGGVCAVLLGESREHLVDELGRHFPGATFVDGGADLRAIADAVGAHVDDPRRTPRFPILMRGTTFQQRVWERLREIPVGSTASYGEIAATLGLPASPRAVARACAANRLAVVVPCHRVVRGDGALAGYRWGVARKEALLARERGA